MMKKLFSFLALNLMLFSVNARADIPGLLDGTDAAALRESEAARMKACPQQPADVSEAINMLNLQPGAKPAHPDKPGKKAPEPSPYLTEMIYRF